MNLEDIKWIEIIDVILVAWLVYQLYKIVRGTVAIRIFLGLFAIYALWKIVEFLQMELLTEILGQFIGVGVIALIIVFQQELRRFLLLVGTPDFLSKNKTAKKFIGWMRKETNEEQLDLDPVIEAVENMAKQKTGALIAIERQSEIIPFINSFVTLDANINADLIQSIFTKSAPLHDGALIIRAKKIKAASAVLPVSEKQLAAKYGTRHRAALGLSELTDSFIIVVSEQNGAVSVVQEGKLNTIEKASKIREVIKEAILQD